VFLDIQRDRSLAVYPTDKPDKEPKEISLLVDPNEKAVSLVRRIIACYLNGYSNIRLRSNTQLLSVQQQAIRDIARKIYMRIIESDTQTMRLTTLIDESQASVISAIHRMYTITKSMCHDALNSLKTHNLDLAKTVYSLDDDVDHFFFFVTRLLRSATIDPKLEKRLDLDPIDCLNYQTLLYRIEHVADNAANIAYNVIMLHEQHLRLSDRMLDLTVEICMKAVVSFDASVKAFFSKDIAHCNEILEQRTVIEALDRQLASALVTDQPAKEEHHAPITCLVSSIRHSIDSIAEHAADIAEITLNRYYEEKD
jgi:phosphate uptake regulator